MICLSKGSRRGVQVKASFAWKGRLCILEMCRTFLSDEPFSVFPDDHSSALIRLCWNYPLFQGETGLYIDEWTGMSLLSHFLQFLL